MKKYSLSDKGLAAKTDEESLKSLRKSQLNRKTDTDFGQCHKGGHPNGQQAYKSAVNIIISKVQIKITMGTFHIHQSG